MEAFQNEPGGFKVGRRGRSISVPDKVPGTGNGSLVVWREISLRLLCHYHAWFSFQGKLSPFSVSHFRGAVQVFDTELLTPNFGARGEI